VDSLSVFFESYEERASGFIEANAIDYHPAEKTDAQQRENRDSNNEPVFYCTFSFCVFHLFLQSYKSERVGVIIKFSLVATAFVYLL